MPLSQKEIENIKKQLKEQAQNFPPEKKEEAINYINSMSDQEVEEFLKQNKQQTQCIFCSIAQKQTPSFSIAEDKNHIAVLDINPLSKGHSLVLPKQHVQETEKEAKKFAETIAQKIHEKFSPKQIKINPLNVMDHAALEVLPLYGDETERKKASEEELKKIQSKLLETEKKEAKKENKETLENCIFCSISENKTPSFKIDENKKCLAILEINPLSKGHSLVLPKQHSATEKIPSTCFTMAKRISKKIKSKLNPREVKITSANMQGHAVVEVLPLYGDETERKKASEEELLEIKKQIEKKPTKPRKKSAKITKKKTASGLPQVPPRIP